MFMTKEGEMTLEHFGSIIFCDFKASGISSLRWPYGAISAVDEENHAVVCSHCLLITESNEAYDVMLETATLWVPSTVIMFRPVFWTWDAPENHSCPTRGGIFNIASNDRYGSARSVFCYS